MRRSLHRASVAFFAVIMLLTAASVCPAHAVDGEALSMSDNVSANGSMDLLEDKLSRSEEAFDAAAGNMHNSDSDAPGNTEDLVEEEVQQESDLPGPHLNDESADEKPLDSVPSIDIAPNDEISSDIGLDSIAGGMSTDITEDADEDDEPAEELTAPGDIPARDGLVRDARGLRLSEGLSWVTSAWRTVGGETYFFGEDGYALSGPQTLAGPDGEEARYYFDGKTFAMHTGWLRWKADGRKSYYGSDGAAVSGWRTISGRRYYFDPADKDHRAARYAKTLSGKRYYFDGKTFAMHTGWLRWKADGRKSYYGSDGAAVSGWRTISGRRYYFDPADKDHRAARYAKTVSGKRYYFDGKTFAMHTGWLRWKADGKWSYYNASGVQLFGKQKIDGYTYNFGTSGKTSQVPVLDPMSKKAQRYSSSTKYLVMTDVKKNYVGIYTGKKGNWVRKYYWRCSSGAPYSPTVLGQFTVYGKGYSFGHGYTCYYYTQFYGDYLFHSIKYYQGTRVVMDGRLGMNISAGCVRLPIANAKWMYDNIPYGTKVVIYK